MPVTSALLDLIRSRGVAVHEMPGWEGRGETDGSFSINGIILHHDAEGLHNDNVPEYMSQNGNNGAQLWVKFDGTLYILAAGRKWHAGSGQGFRNIPASAGNSYCVGIETDYSGSGPRDARIDATIHTVTRCIVEHHGLDPQRDLALHKEYAPDRKVDLANFDADNWRNRAAQPFGPQPPVVNPPAPKPPTPKPPVEESYMRLVKVNGFEPIFLAGAGVWRHLSPGEYNFVKVRKLANLDLLTLTPAEADQMKAVCLVLDDDNSAAANPSEYVKKWPSAQPTPAPTTTKIAPGEGFDAVARRLHVTPDQLAAANPQVKNRDSINAGDTLNIPKV